MLIFIYDLLFFFKSDYSFIFCESLTVLLEIFQILIFTLESQTYYLCLHHATWFVVVIICFTSIYYFSVTACGWLFYGDFGLLWCEYYCLMLSLWIYTVLVLNGYFYFNTANQNGPES